jgi:hypothetical protein
LGKPSTSDIITVMIHISASKRIRWTGKVICTSDIEIMYIVAHTATIRDGVWIDNWIYWTQLNYTARYYTLQFTVSHTHTNLLSPGVCSLVVTSQLSHNSSGPRTSCRPTHCLRTPNSLTHGNSAASAGSVYSPAGTYSLAAEQKL